MPSAPSQTRIVNRALVLLGTSKRISSLNENSELAKIALAVFDDARDEVTADHPWNHAIGRATLAADDVAPDFGYAARYPLPGDCLRWLPPAPGDEWWFAGEQEGSYLLSDADAPLRIRYIRRVEDPSGWAPGFINALACRLAMELAEAATGGKEDVGERAAAAYADALQRAKRQDGLATGDRGGRQEFRSDWLAARGRRW